ncbi:MAG TPA: hypothetical protein VF263_00445 [Longimicrobiaceae bacterium]
MHLVHVLLPLNDNQGRPFGREPFDLVRRELAERFGGVTAHFRAPAQGVWRDPGGDVARDEVVTLEVMVADTLDRAWWADFRRRLEALFRQDEVVVRAVPMERL